MFKARKFVIAAVVGATLASGAGASIALASTGGRDDAAKKPAARMIDVRHENEARGRIAEGEREVGDDRGRDAGEAGEREAEDRGRIADGEAPRGEDGMDDRAADDRGRDSSGHRGSDDGPGHDRGDDRGGDSGHDGGGDDR